MASFHINPATGDPGECNADPSKPGAKGCPFGGSDEHYGSKAEARDAFEKSMENVAGATAKPVDRKTARLKALTQIPQDIPFDSLETFDAQEALDAVRELNKGMSKEEKIAAGWNDPDGLSGPTWRNFTNEAWGARARFAAINAQRYASALSGERASDPRSIEELVTAGELTETSESRRLTDTELSVTEAIAGFSRATQKSIQKLPASFLNVLADTPYSESNVKPLVKLMEGIRAVEPDYIPRQGITPPQRVTGRRSSQGVPQMQKIGAYGYGLLQKYAEVSFGSRAKEFWETVESNSVNYPKISDYMRAVKNFS